MTDTLTDAPDFSLPATGGQTLQLSQLRDAIVVLYFYPKDNTPGCTHESRDFAARHEAFLAAGAHVFGISRDSIKSHENFKARFALPFELLSDAEETACLAFDVIKQKKMYGKDVRGIERSTFVIDRQGRIARAWRGVKVDGHADAVLAFVQTL